MRVIVQILDANDLEKLSFHFWIFLNSDIVFHTQVRQYKKKIQSNFSKKKTLRLKALDIDI